MAAIRTCSADTATPNDRRGCEAAPAATASATAVDGVLGVEEEVVVELGVEADGEVD